MYESLDLKFNSIIRSQFEYSAFNLFLNITNTVLALMTNIKVTLGCVFSISLYFIYCLFSNGQG